MTEVQSKERDLLKKELQDLKQCQVGYFTATITATGVILGLAEKLASTPDAKTLVFFAPLLIILPCWTVFFDKATSVTRIVGYSRVLEMILTRRKGAQYRYIGWENALAEYRENECQATDQQCGFLGDVGRMFKNAFRSLWLFVNFRREHRYWAINWATFFGLGSFCLCLAYRRGSGTTSLWWGFAVVFFFVCLHNADVLYELVRGRYSYNERVKRWQKTLETVEDQLQ